MVEKYEVRVSWFFKEYDKDPVIVVCGSSFEIIGSLWMRQRKVSTNLTRIIGNVNYKIYVFP